MVRYNICSIDEKVNGNKTVTFLQAMRSIILYIKREIDPTFPAQEFREWYDSGTDKPFRWNKRIYYWRNIT